MNYPMQYGLGGLNTVQNMSDRNMAETLMANGGQRFAKGGISNIPRMAAGGVPTYKFDPITGKYTQIDDVAVLPGVPKYTYDPVTQKYTLVTEKNPLGDAFTKDSGGDSGGGGDNTPTPTPFDNMTLSERSTFFADPKNSFLQDISLFGQKAFSMTPYGKAQAALAPDFVRDTRTSTQGIDPVTGFQNQGRGQTGVYGDIGVVFNPDGSVKGYDPGIYGPASIDSNSGPSGGFNSGPASIDSVSGPSGGFDSGGGGGGFDGGGPDGGGNTSADGRGEARGGLNLYGKYYPPKYAYGGIAALAQGGYTLGDYSDGGRLLRGPGDGVSDSIPATIANKQPARLADGEFVVPARIVSELGNGSTEAGARKLYQMLARVQNARKKSIGQGRVAVNSRAEKLLPA